MPSLIRNPVTLWLGTSPVTRAELQAFDKSLGSAINGDLGGAWGPASPLVITGGGLSLATTCAPLAITRGGQLTSLAAGVFRCADGDFPQLAEGHPGRTRTILYPCVAGRGLPGYLWWARRKDFAFQAIAPMYDDSTGAGFQPARALVPIRAHDGATLSQAVVHFRVTTPHTAIPPTLPKVRVLRQDPNGVISTLTSQAAGGDLNGFVSATKPNTVDDWNNQGLDKTIAIACDQNNVVDISQYAYLAEIVEEQGLTGYPWQVTIKKPVKCATTGTVSLLGGSPIDGVPLAFGDRVLVTGGGIANGIYSYAAGAGSGGTWSRASDLVRSSDYTRGFLVPVQLGDANGGALFQGTAGAGSFVLPTWDTPGIATIATWSISNGAFAKFGYVRPTPSRVTGYIYQYIDSSGSGTTQGVDSVHWPRVIGQQVIDNPGLNQVVWQCAAIDSDPIRFAARSSTPDEPGTLVANGIAWQAIAVTYTNIADQRWQ
jgi:hypothetical protein